GRRRRVIYLTERRYRRLALWAGPLAAIVLAVGVLVRWPRVFALVASVILVAAASVAVAGRSGYYEVEVDGSLGEYLGQRRPDLSGLRRSKARGSTVTVS